MPLVPKPLAQRLWALPFLSVLAPSQPYQNECAPWVLVRDLQGVFSPQSLLWTDVDADAVQIVQWFVSRWQVEVTLREVREHLGVETQRQWNTSAMARTTPVLIGLFSIVTFLASS
jgi:hypothetical protein